MSLVKHNKSVVKNQQLDETVSNQSAGGAALGQTAGVPTHYPDESDHLMDNEDSSMGTAHHAFGTHQCCEEEEEKIQETCCNGRFLKVTYFLKIPTPQIFLSPCL